MNQKVFGYRNYKADKKEFYLDDFKDVKILQLFLNEVCTGESDITEDGIKYLSEDVGLENISEALSNTGGLIENGFKTANEIYDYLSRIIPHDTARFIYESRKKNGDKKALE